MPRIRHAALVFLLALAAPVAAQEPATRALAERYLSLPANREMIDTMFSAETLGAQFAASLPPAMQPSERQQAEIGALMARELGAIRGDMETEMVSGAMATFTAEELEALIAFNETPIGESITRKMPAYMQQTMVGLAPRVAEMIQGIAPELTRILTQP